MKRALLALLLAAASVGAQTISRVGMYVIVRDSGHGGHAGAQRLVPFGQGKLQLHDSVRVHTIATWNDGTKTVLTPVGGVVRAAALAVTQQPDHAVVGVALAHGILVQVLNPEGLPIAAPDILVTVTAKGAKLTGTLSGVTNVQGRVLFANLILMDTARTTLTFSSPGVFLRATQAQPIRVSAPSTHRRG